MSIWKSTTYKLDIARQVYETLYEFHTDILGSQIGHYLSPLPLLSGLEPHENWEALAFACDWDDNISEPAVLDDFMEHYGKVKKWFLGSSSLFQIVNAVMRDKFQCRNSYPRGKLDKLAQEIGKLIAPSTQISLEPFLKVWGRREDLFWQRGHRFEDASEAFKFMRFAFNSKGDGLHEIDQEKFFGDGQRVYYGHIVGSLCIMKGAGEYGERGMIFTRGHLNLLIEGLMRIANIYYYLATEYALEGMAACSVEQMLTYTIEQAFKAKRKNADKVVQAFHKARMYAQMLIFENKHKGALEEAKAEYYTKGLNDVVPLERYLEIVLNTPPRRRLDAMQVYKWMMPPDFDSTYAFEDLYKWHMNPRPSGADLGAKPEMKANWERVVEERKRNIVVAFHSKTKEWPVWAVDGITSCQPNNTANWDLQKLFPYHAYGSDIISQIKDKATVSASFNRELSGEATNEETSFLLWYMVHGCSVNTETDAQDLRRGVFPEDNYARVAYKGEAHKPGSRLFFMAPPRARILLGELEGNISDVAHFYPGSLQGKDSHQKSEMMQKLFDVNQDPPGVDESAQYEIFVITFDLAKFSPKSNFNVTRDYHNFWAVVFGYPAIEDMVRIGPLSRIMHTQSGLKMTYNNIGADLEGFRGRLMTLFHADMLGAACRKAKEEGVILGKAVLAVFIDDGAVKVAASGYGDEALKNANRFLAIMQEIYAAAGQENHPNKTIVSKIGGELLAEQFLYGERIKVPIKAAMRLYPDYENPACCVTEEFDALFAASQGCVKDQGTWSPTYYRYVYAFIKALYRWERTKVRHMPVPSLAFKVITPKAFGGFGIQPWQGLVATVTLDLTSEGLGILNRIGRAYPQLRDQVEVITTQPLLLKDPLSILRDPTRVRITGKILVENRLLMAILSKLEEPGHAASRFMRGYKSAELREHAIAVSIAMSRDPTISVTALQAGWHSTPLAYIESVVGKFRRAKSIMAMLGEKVVSSIRRKNAKDVSEVLGYA